MTNGCDRPGAHPQGGWNGENTHGTGRLVYSDGSVYEGAFFDGMKHGAARMQAHAGGARRQALNR